jgi:phenylacetate-CoA ligase
MALADEAVMSACFEAAREHPFHRERLRGIADWRAAPAIDKCDLLPALRAFSVHDEPLGVYLVRSGGSTQAPLIFPVDIGENHAQRAALAGRLREAGVFGPRTVALNVFGYADLYRTAAILDDLLERCAATALPLSAHARYEDMYAAALRFRPTHLLGTPSKLALFGHFLAASAHPRGLARRVRNAADLVAVRRRRKRNLGLVRRDATARPLRNSAAGGGGDPRSRR